LTETIANDQQSFEEFGAVLTAFEGVKDVKPWGEEESDWKQRKPQEYAMIIDKTIDPIIENVCKENFFEELMVNLPTVNKVKRVDYQP
jgi:hypothetical protein